MAGARRASRRRYVLLVDRADVPDADHRSTPATAGRGPWGPWAGSPTGRLADRGGGRRRREPGQRLVARRHRRGNLKRENRDLEEQIAALRGKQAAADQAIEENSGPEGGARAAERLLVKNVTAMIVGRDPGNFDPTFTIDKGSEAGIAVDMPVIAPDGVVVGKVIDVVERRREDPSAHRSELLGRCADARARSGRRPRRRDRVGTSRIARARGAVRRGTRRCCAVTRS